MSDEILQSNLTKWFKFQKNHKSIPVPYEIQTNEIIESSCFQILILSIDNLLLKQNSKQIKFYGNLYSSAKNQFFGRTYESEFCDLQFGSDGKTITIDPLMIYFHIKAINDPNILLIIEIVVFEKDINDVIVDQRVIGWGQIGATVITKQLAKMNLRSGTSRLLLNKFKQQYEVTQQNIIFDIQEIKWFNQIKFLLPEGCLCGSGDQIQGTNEMFIPKGQINNFEQTLTLQKNNVVFVSGIKVQIPISVENQLKNNLTRYKEIKFKQENQGTNAIPNQIKIVARRIVVGSHNGWTFTNTRGIQNICILDEGSEVQQFIGQEQVDYRIMEFKGSLDVNYVQEVLVFQLEYEIQYMVAQLGKQIITIQIGWFPLLIPQFNKIDNYQFEDNLIVGPGRNVLGNKLSDLNDIQHPLVVSGRVNGTIKQNLEPDEEKFESKQLIQKPSPRIILKQPFEDAGKSQAPLSGY